MAGPNGEPFFIPAQLLDSGLALLGVLIITQLEKRSNLPRGSSLGMTFIAYGLGRFIYEFFRFGETSELLPGLALSFAQVVSALMAILGIGILIWARRHKPVEVS